MYPLVAPPATCASRCGAAARTLVGRAAERSTAVLPSHSSAAGQAGAGGGGARAAAAAARGFGPRRAFFGLPRASRDPRRVARANRARGGSVDAGGPRRRLARRARRRVAGRSSRDDVSLRSVGSVALAPQRARGARPGAGRVASRAPASPTRQPCGSRLPACGGGQRAGGTAARRPPRDVRCAHRADPADPAGDAGDAGRQRSTFSPRKTGSTTFAAGTRSPVVKVSLSVLD